MLLISQPLGTYNHLKFVSKLSFSRSVAKSDKVLISVSIILKYQGYTGYNTNQVARSMHNITLAFKATHNMISKQSVSSGMFR